MTKKTPDPFTANRAQSLRQNQTRSEGFLWSILRAKQLCGLKFRRQHPTDLGQLTSRVQPELLVVEIDGEYHDETMAKDLRRQEGLERRGWTVIRFSDEDVENDVEAIGQAIAKAEIAAALPSLSLDPPRGRVKMCRYQCLDGEG